MTLDTLQYSNSQCICIWRAYQLITHSLRPYLIAVNRECEHKLLQMRCFSDALLLLNKRATWNNVFCVERSSGILDRIAGYEHPKPTVFYINMCMYVTNKFINYQTDLTNLIRLCVFYYFASKLLRLHTGRTERAFNLARFESCISWNLEWI